MSLYQLMSVCRSSRAGVQEHLRTLPGLVVCGGRDGHGVHVRDVWRLNLATLQWERMPPLLTARDFHACCVVRGRLVVFGENLHHASSETSVETLVASGDGGEGAFEELPPLSAGTLFGACAIPVEESESAAGHVLLLGGLPTHPTPMSTGVRLVDLATGACAPQPDLLRPRFFSAAGRLSDGRIVCAGGMSLANSLSAEMGEHRHMGHKTRHGAGQSSRQ